MRTRAKDQNRTQQPERFERPTGAESARAASQRPRLPPDPSPVLPNPVLLSPPVVFVLEVLLLLVDPPTQFQEIPEQVHVVPS